MPASLTQTDAAIVKGMLARGDKQHDVAAWFGCNPGRVAEIKTGVKHRSVEPAPTHALPPPGPYSYFTDRPGESLPDQLRKVLAEFDLKWSRELAVTAHERRQTNEKIDRLTRQHLELQRKLGAVENHSAPRTSRRRPVAAS